MVLKSSLINKLSWSNPESPPIEVGVSMRGETVARALERLSFHRPLPRVVTVDNGSEFHSRALDSWAYRHGVRLGLDGQATEFLRLTSRGSEIS